MWGKVTRRRFLVGAGAWLLLLRAAGRAEAEAVARGSVALAELRAQSSCCIVGRPVARESQWVMLGGARRLVTVHQVQVDDVIEGVAEGPVLAVRTLGGRVGQLGQRVFGEAALRPDAPAVFFLYQVERDLYVVTDMAGGYYPLEMRGGVPHLRATIEATPGSAAERLAGTPLPSMRQLLLAPAGALHEP